MPTLEDIDINNLPFASDSCPCGYYPEKTCSQIYIITEWFEKLGLSSPQHPFPLRQLYGLLKQNGFCRYSELLYLYDCKNCQQCAPIRIPVSRFKPSKNQRAAWNKNQDIEVTLQKDPELFVSEERALLLREYDAYHNSSQPGYQKKTLDEAMQTLREMNYGYGGTWNLEFRLNGRLIGVSVIDYTEDFDETINATCSNYFYYEISEEVAKRSIGVFSILKELELCRELNIPYHYLGLYLIGDRKMNYKNSFEPNELFVNESWIPSDLQLPPPGSVDEEYPDICFITEDINPAILLAAYKQGIFPWFNEENDEPVIWQSPDPRFIIPIEELHIPKTLKKFLKHSPYTYTMDKCFDQVMRECGTMERKDQNGTWIGKKMLKAYSKFHKMGYAHSFEVWHNEKLVGGFYGILMGSLFCGESMFTLEDNSSSSAFVLFAQRFAECGGKLIDCQAYTDNMKRYGAREVPRQEYLKLLQKNQRIRMLKDLKDLYEFSSKSGN